MKMGFDTSAQSSDPAAVKENDNKSWSSLPPPPPYQDFAMGRPVLGDVAPASPGRIVTTDKFLHGHPSAHPFYNVPQYVSESTNDADERGRRIHDIPRTQRSAAVKTLLIVCTLAICAFAILIICNVVSTVERTSSLNYPMKERNHLSERDLVSVENFDDNQGRLPLNFDREYTVDYYEGETFFDNFEFEAISDPTHGFVEYATRAEAERLRLISADKGVIIRAESETKLDPSSIGRKSVRIRSKKGYDSAFFVFDVAHMPFGCGTWPALWTYSPDHWPDNGEMDFFEGTNSQTKDWVTVHVKESTCRLQGKKVLKSSQKSKILFPNCNVDAENQPPNAGCGVELNSKRSFGHSFNMQGGGMIVADWQKSGIRVWFFQRNNIPTNLKERSNSPPDTSKWPKPVYVISGGDCDFAERIRDQHIVINLTFCGDLGGATFRKERCPGECASFVAANPQAFKNAYWAINSITVYS